MPAGQRRSVFFFFSGLQWNLLFWPPIFSWKISPVWWKTCQWLSQRMIEFLWMTINHNSEAMQNTFMWEHSQPSVLPHQPAQSQIRFSTGTSYRNSLQAPPAASAGSFQQRTPPPSWVHDPALLALAVLLVLLVSQFVWSDLWQMERQGWEVWQAFRSYKQSCNSQNACKVQL